MKVSGLKPGMKSGYRISEEALRALQAGDTDALMKSHRGRWGMFMGPDDDGDDDSDDDDDDDDDSAGGGDDDDKRKKSKRKNGDNDDDDDSGDDDDDDDDDDKAAMSARLRKMEARMKAADQRATKAEKRLRDIDDADKSDLQKANDRVEEVEKENTSLKSEVSDLRLNIAFLSANKVTWHKPGAALRLAQSEGYLEDVVGDDGQVDEKALGAALARLAKDNDYLVKPREDAGPSGESGGGKSNNGKDDKATKESDRRRAPALARRR